MSAPLTVTLCQLCLLFSQYAILIPVPCKTLQSTTDIIVNFTSTAMGSNATYQCRDGSSDVYTTQCTSDGVWEPNPNSTLDCTSPAKIMVYATYTMQSTCSHSLYIHCFKARWRKEKYIPVIPPSPSLSLFSQYNCHCTSHWRESGNHCHNDCSSYCSYHYCSDCSDPNGQLLCLEKKCT